MNPTIHIPKEKIEKLCRQNHIIRLSVFGSALSEKFSSDSDIDFLVEFEPGHVPGFAFFKIQDELSELLGRKVELNTPNFLSRYFRDEVLSHAEVQYVAD
jgi:predicted nucleotidyltransferase